MRPSPSAGANEAEASGSDAEEAEEPLGSLAGEAVHPVFGAPVAALSAERVQALPIDLGRAFGEAEANAFLDDLEARHRECTPPRESERRLCEVMSPWGDLKPLPRKPEASEHWPLSCAEAFDSPDMLRAVGEYKARVATHFNALQDKDPLSDGIRMNVKLHMLSVVCHFSVPLPSHERWELSCARNMRLAIKAIPYAEPGKLQSKFMIL